MLAYVFWHRPAGDAAGYEEALAAFHARLAEAAPPGFRESVAFAVTGATWMREPLYEDWYAVDGWEAIGVLNEAAVDARRRHSHDAVAAGARSGAGGIYLRRAGDGPTGAAGEAVWAEKPAGVPHGDFRARLAGHQEAWERQLVLGPAPEYCLVGDAVAAPAAGTVVRRRAIWR